MQNFVSERSKVIREFFKLDEKIELINADAIPRKQKPDVEAYLSAFNMEWHLIPSADALPFDQRYIDSLYPTSCISSGKHGRQCDDLRLALKNGHTKHQGRMIAVEVTQKPGYLPENRQFYGTRYGFESTADPFSRYLGRASFVNGTRFAHNYPSLREFVQVVSDDWKSRSMMPEGYRLTVCPPAVFNFVGTLFHTEWSDTETPELGFYRDSHGNATCYAVGCNGPGDFSFLRAVEGDADWTLLGFRVALVPE